MALSITCSGCDAVYPVGENLIGKTIRCKKCGEMMPVVAPSKSKPVIQIEDGDEEAPRRPSRRRVEEEEDDTPRRPSRRREEAVEDEEPKPRSKRRAAEDEDDEDDRPRRGGREKVGQKSKKSLILGGLLTLAIIGGGIGVAIYSSGGDEGDSDDKPKIASNDKGVSPPNGTPVPRPDNSNNKSTTPPVTPAVTTPPMTAPTTATPPKTTDAPKAADVPKVSNPPIAANVAPPVAVGRGANNNAGALDLPNEIGQVNISRVKRAAVFIKTETETSSSTGSGWVGLESDLVFTNAHVLGMKAPNSPEPKKLTFYLNAGTPDQMEIPHSKLKILAVDREIDLAVIRVIGFPSMPTPLKIRLSSGLRDAETVYTIGFPLGSKLAVQVGQTRKEPSVSVRKTTVSGTVEDDYGQAVKIKVESGIQPGNSGGAVIDTNGDVVAVVVATFGSAQSGFIGMAIPTEFVNGLVAGRVAKLEYGIPYREKDKVKVPVTAHVLNPFEKAMDIHVRHWIGDANASYRVPGNEFPKVEPNDTNSVTVELKYDTKSKSAVGELTYPDAPAGRTYWAQPYFSNALTRYRMPGIKVPMTGPPVERVPANLVANPKIGSRRAVTLTSSSDLTEDFEGEGEEKDERIKIKSTLKVNEVVEKPDNNDATQLARLKLLFESINLSAEGFGGALQQDILNKRNQEQLNAIIKQAVAYGLINRFGEMYRYTVNAVGGNDLLFTFLVNALAGDALEAMQATSIRMPNGQMTPGQTWTSDKDIRLQLISAPAPVAPGTGGAATPPRRTNKPREYKYRDHVTYTYLGLRERSGRKEAVIQIEGKSVQAPGSKQTVTGSVKGLAWVEIDTGVVVDANIKKEFELDTSSEGSKKKVTGIYEYTIARGTAQ